MPTLCEQCDHVVDHTRKLHPRLWLCIKHKRLEGFGFVAPKVWIEKEPYMRCEGINGGACPSFEKRRKETD